MIRQITLLASLCFISSLAQAQTVITDASLVGGQTYDWTADTEYILDGLVYLEAGATLNIEPGTVIRARPQTDITTGDLSTALIIAQGAQIFAEGTASSPIIFTALSDDLTNQATNDPSAQDRGLWGGVIVLGRAPLGFSAETSSIEGINASETRVTFGGTDPEDNSGVLTYISIRHGGFALAGGDEINGLTLGGVGRGTTIDYVEVFANSDDGIEWFGGTVDVKHASVAFCGDDAFDYDLGWRGRGQFWFALQEPSNPEGTGRSGEHDGAIPDGSTPFSQPTIYNATYIGVGNGASVDEGDASNPLTFSVIFRDNAAGYYNNSLFTGFNGAAIAIEQLDNDNPDSWDRFQAGDLGIRNNIFEDFQRGTDAADMFLVVDSGEEILAAPSAEFATALASDNVIGATGIASISRTPDGMLDPRINVGGAALGGGVINEDDDYFTPVSYRGAFGNSANWLLGWTALDNMGYLGDLVTPVNPDLANCKVISDDDLVGGETYNWGPADAPCYSLDGLVYLEADATLNIAAGTVIRGLNADAISTGDNTSALIVAQNAQIFARGTAAEPIIFTSANDDLNNEAVDDPTIEDRGLWGGVIILGNAPIGFSSETSSIEGINASETRVTFGGTDPMDNSGVLNYVSIRHGGFALAGGDEINGLTLGGVGSGTMIDYVEVFANSDDGIEWFGGTVRVDHAAVAFCGDDAFDYDLGWRGGGQFWFAIQDPNNPEGTGRSGEHDGAIPDASTPFSQPTIYNATYVGVGNGQAVDDGDASDPLTFSVIFRDAAGGFYNNSIFTDFNGAAIAIERQTSQSVDSWARYQANELRLRNNMFFNFQRGDAPQDLFVVVDGGESVLTAETVLFATAMTADGNRIIDPLLNNFDDRFDGNPIDVRPNPFGLAASGAPAAEAGFASVDYYGAFEPASGLDNESWINGWTAISESMEVADFLNSNSNQTVEGFVLSAPQPNPASGLTTVEFELPRAMEVNLTVLDLSGRPISGRNRRFSAGINREELNISQLPNGIYFVALTFNGGRLVQKLIVNH